MGRRIESPLRKFPSRASDDSGENAAAPADVITKMNVRRPRERGGEEKVGGERLEVSRLSSGGQEVVGWVGGVRVLTSL